MMLGESKFDEHSKVKNNFDSMNPIFIYSSMPRAVAGYPPAAWTFKPDPAIEAMRRDAEEKEQRERQRREEERLRREREEKERREREEKERREKERKEER